MNVPQAGFSERFLVSQGGIQGRVDIPKWFRAMMETALDSLHPVWCRKGWGVKMADKQFTHTSWADSIWLFALTRNQLKQMIKGNHGRTMEAGLDVEAIVLRGFATERSGAEPVFVQN